MVQRIELLSREGSKLIIYMLINEIKVFFLSYFLFFDTNINNLQILFICWQPDMLIHCKKKLLNFMKTLGYNIHEILHSFLSYELGTIKETQIQNIMG